MIEVRSLRKTYPGGVEAVRGIDFDVGPGEVFGLLGPNGAGKSTTIGMLTTTIRPTAGTATLDGLDVSRDPLAARRASSVVFQEAVVDRGLTGRRHLDLHARLWGVEQRQATQRIDDVTAALGLGTLIDRMVGSYSGGERRRLELARALVSRPRVLFLDEPTVGLDPLIRHELLDLRIDGDAPAALAVLRDRGIARDDAFLVGSTVTVPLNGHASSEVMAAVGELRLATSVISRPPTLDDVYLRLTGGRLAEAA